MLSCYTIFERIQVIKGDFSIIVTLVSRITIDLKILLIDPPELLSKPWRSHDIKWTPENKYQLLEDIYNFKVKGGVPYLTFC